MKLIRLHEREVEPKGLNKCDVLKSNLILLNANSISSIEPIGENSRINMNNRNYHIVFEGIEHIEKIIEGR